MAWHEQESEIADTSKCSKCTFGTKGPCQNPTDKVCYPRDTCPPGSSDKTDCCPANTIDCITESFIDKIESENYKPFIIFYLPLILLLIYFFYKYFMKTKK